MDSCHLEGRLQCPLRSDYTSKPIKINSSFMTSSKTKKTDFAQQRRQRLTGIALMCGAVAALLRDVDRLGLVAGHELILLGLLV